MKKSFTPEQRQKIPYNWLINGRKTQLFPVREKWRKLLIMAGRGSGKTRTGSETIRYFIENNRAHRIAIIGKTESDVHKVMIYGDSGLMTVCPPWNRPIHNQKKKTLAWPCQKCYSHTCQHDKPTVHTYSGDKPSQLIGTQHDTAWVDEIQKFQYPDETLKQMRLGLRRKGGESKQLFTCTPLRLAVIRKLKSDPTVKVLGGRTHDNRDNLSEEFIEDIEYEFKGTSLWDQEIEGILIDDNPLAIWQRDWLDRNIVKECPVFDWIVVAVDPNTSNTEKSDEMGIVVVGMASNGHHYILADRSMRGTVLERGNAVGNAYNEFSADVIVYEANQGGDMVAHMIAGSVPNASMEAVWASRGKRTRAEPIGMLHQQGRSHFVERGDEDFFKLKNQLCDWLPGEKSPDRMDALVWAETWLIGKYGDLGGGVIDLTHQYPVDSDDIGALNF